MGGTGSGGHNRKSDEEKRRDGTFRADRSDSAYDARMSEKVHQGPWLSEIPKADFKLGETGQRYYDIITRELFEQNKLDHIRVMHANAAALLYDKFERLANEEKSPSASDMTQLQRALSALGVAKDAKKIAEPTQRNRFESCGFSNRRNATVILRKPAAARTGD